MRTFEVNGKKYNAVPYDINTSCDMEDMGVSIGDIQGRKMSFIRAYFAICAGMSVVDAGKEINEHFIKYKNLNSITEAFNKELEESDFFQALIEGAKTENAENPSEEEQEKVEATTKA